MIKLFLFHNFVLKCRSEFLSKPEIYLSSLQFDIFVKYIYLDLFEEILENKDLIDLFILLQNSHLYHFSSLILSEISIENVLEYISLIRENNLTCYLEYSLALFNENISTVRVDHTNPDLMKYYVWSIQNKSTKFEELQLFESTFQKDIDQVFNDRKYTDLTMIITDIWKKKETLHFHKAIIQYQSEYFCDFLFSMNFKNDVLYLDTSLSIDSFLILSDIWYFRFPNLKELKNEELIFLCVWGPMYLSRDIDDFFEHCLIEFNARSEDNEHLNEILKTFTIEMLQTMLSKEFSDPILVFITTHLDEKISYLNLIKDHPLFLELQEQNLSQQTKMDQMNTTIEEMHTTNEEMHTTIEEMHTTIEEMHTTIEEMNKKNEEMNKAIQMLQNND